MIVFCVNADCVHWENAGEFGKCTRFEIEINSLQKCEQFDDEGEDE